MKVDKITLQIAALYLGQKCEVYIRYSYPDESAKGLVTLSPHMVELIQNGEITITPHLRRLDSITEEEAKYLFSLESYVSFEDSIYAKSFVLSYESELEWAKGQFNNHLFFNPHQYLYLLSRGFDMFGLIDAGLANEII